jgi:dihydroflavonol-4-reductase
MKTLITGATGFIGSHVADRLIQGGHELCCLVRKRGPAVERLKALGANLVVGDVTNKQSVLQGMKGCDWVVHLAGLYSFWEPHRKAYAEVNITGTRNVWESALETGISKGVHVSTVGVYGRPTDSPFREESESGPRRFCEYFRTKYEADRIVWDLHRKQGLPVVVVYPCAVVGPGDTKATGQYVADLLRRRLPATVFDNSVMTFVHVNDVAEVILKALTKPDNIGEKYLAGNQQLSFREINRMVHDISGVPLPRLHLPGAITMVNAALFTGLAGVIKKAPPWGMSIDQMKVMREGFKVDGSKAERDLCVKYTPIRVALEEAIASYAHDQ